MPYEHGPRKITGRIKRERREREREREITLDNTN